MSRRTAAVLLGGLLGVMACEDTGPPPKTSDAAPDADVAGSPWSGEISVIVRDPAGVPVADVSVMMGGQPASDWASTDAEGQAALYLPATAFSGRYVTAGKWGWFSAGARVADDRAPPGPVELTLAPLPADDNPDYAFQEGGSAANMGGTGQCMHCHISIGEQWNQSAHRDANANPRTLDLFNGTARLLEAADCEALGGTMVESSTRGEGGGGREPRCVTGRGVLPAFNGICGGEGQPSCDDADLDRSGLARLGGCGDCHGTTAGGSPGAIDLNTTQGFLFDEGITCDLCHKIAEVDPHGGVGIDGAIRLHRPSVPAEHSILDWEPIQFGPYPDVLNALMGGAYQPQFRQSVFCAGCHEHRQPTLDPGLPLDPERWPDGLPIQTTFSEWQASPFGEGRTCQGCHMASLDEDSSTFDLEDGGFRPSVAMGWIRPPGEVRRHDWPTVASLGAQAVEIALDVQEEADHVRVAATVNNVGAGHAFPTGEPLRQVAVLLEADVDGSPQAPSGGQVVPDVGGALASGVLGTNAVLEGERLTLDGGLPSGPDLKVRFARPTGSWEDYDGPGIGWFSEPERSPEEKGLPHFDWLGEVAIASVGPEGIVLAGPPPAVMDGDHVYIVDSRMWAGAPGWLYAKILVGADGQRAVHHYEAVDIASDNRIAAGAKGTSVHRYPKPADGTVLTVAARVVYRRQAAGVASGYGWPLEDLEVATATARWPSPTP